MNKKISKMKFSEFGVSKEGVRIEDLIPFTSKNLDDAMNTYAYRFAEDFADNLAYYSPVDTGRLEASWRPTYIERNGDTYTIFVDGVYYGYYVDQGGQDESGVIRRFPLHFTKQAYEMTEEQHPNAVFDILDSFLTGLPFDIDIDEPKPRPYEYNYRNKKHGYGNIKRRVYSSRYVR